MPEEKDTDELDTETLLAELEADGDVPGEVKAVDAGDASAQGKASHAFAEQKRKAKAIAALARQQQQEIEELKKNQKSAEPPPPPAPTAGAVSAKSILAALTNQAMQNLGLFSITNPEEQELVAIERNRLYGAAMNRRDEESRVSGSAPRVIGEKLDKFNQLDDVGKAEIAKRLGSYNVLQRTDDDVIRSEVIKYLGELTLAGQSGEAHSGDDGDSASAHSPQERSSAQAAASAVKSGRAHLSVKPGGKGNPPPQVKPATPEEMAEMHKLKMMDVASFRAAKQRSSLYKGR